LAFVRFPLLAIEHASLLGLLSTPQCLMALNIVGAEDCNIRAMIGKLNPEAYMSAATW
jgi:hypothetical protein